MFRRHWSIIKWFKNQAKKNPRLVWLLLLSGGALLYLKAWLPLTRIGIPCVFHELTGRYCPGCGITRAALALLQLDFAQAFRYHALVFLLLPMYALYKLANQRQWRAAGRAALTVMVAVTLLFGVLRNVPAFDWLAPTETADTPS